MSPFNVPTQLDIKKAAKQTLVTSYCQLRLNNPAMRTAAVIGIFLCAALLTEGELVVYQLCMLQLNSILQ